jgi:FtsZ-interacting cell division protein ZipA
VTQLQIVAFRDCVMQWAQQHGARVTAPDPAPAVARAAELDQFCAAVDVAVGLNVVAAKGATFAATRIRELAEAAGLRLGSDGVFRLRDPEDRTLFTLDNHEPMPFVPEQVRTMTTGGVTLLIDVPRVPDGPQAFDRMVAAGRELAAGLGGSLVDDNRAPVTDAGIAKIRTQLRGIQLRMADEGIVAGGRRARRLFS